MNKLVFMVEEKAMLVTLNVILPKILPPNFAFQIIKHEGKSDLKKSIPRKLRAWNEPCVSFVVLRDNDNAVCEEIKNKIQGICEKAGRPDTLIRIVCQTLESWFLGDMAALAAAFNQPKIAAYNAKAMFRDPDGLGNPSEEIGKIIPGYQKVSGARKVASYLNLDRNCSTSFNVFVSGLQRLTQQQPC